MKLLYSTVGFASLTLILACEPVTHEVEISSPEATVTVRLDPFEIRISAPDGRGVLATLPGAGHGPYGSPAAGIDDPGFEPTITPGWDTYRQGVAIWRRGSRALLHSQSESAATFDMVVSRVSLRIAVVVDGPRVRLRLESRQFADTERGNQFDVVGLSFRLQPDEHFFGLGERYASVDHRGLSLYSWAEEAGIGQGEGVPPGPENPYPNGPSMTYFPVPFFLSTKGYGLYADTTFRTEMHLGSERFDAWRLTANASELDLIIYVNDDPLETLRQYTADTGRPPVPAPWVFGPRRRVNRGTTVDGVDEWQALRQRGVPTTGIDDSVHFLPHLSHLGREAALAAWTSTLHANGYKVMAYNNPYVSDMLDKAQPDYQYGVDHGLFATTPAGSIGQTWFISGEFQTVATIDLTKPEAVVWYQHLLRRTLALGYDGWMHDFGEYVDRKWVFSDGRRGDEVHNIYPVLSAKAAFDLLEAERPGDYLFFVRSGYSGTQAYVPAVWGGDAEASFDETQGLPAALRGGLNLALSGVPYWGSDISGFKCVTDDLRDKEMYLRWAELGAVSPIMQDQNACVDFPNNQLKWTLWRDDETVEVYGRMARLHTRLQPYFTALAQGAHETGRPLMLHPFLLFPFEPEAWDVEDAFFLGRSLYAAPVVRRGKRSKRVWLPPGRYVDLDDHRVYSGGQRVEIPAPLDKLPLLIRAGHMVPMLDASIETLAPATDAGVVTVNDVADRLDVIVALRAGERAIFTLADGTRLDAERRVDDVGNPGNLVAADEATLATCAGCYREDASGDVSRLRVTTTAGKQTVVVYGDVVLEARGPQVRRTRWDILRLP